MFGLKWQESGLALGNMAAKTASVERRVKVRCFVIITFI